jgi:hypothetical protein
MGGMFYSLQEVAERLKKTEDEIREIVKQGRLREFRDGPNLLFKIDEVESLLSDTSIMGAAKKPKADDEDIILAPEEEGKSPDEDTMLDAAGIDVLEETESEFKLADDTKGETKSGSGEASLEEIEDDVNLETFGSGSGLLDLSLQADDTSLGGILDEIYTAEGGEAKEAETQTAAASGTAMPAETEVEQAITEEMPTAAPPEPVAAMQAYQAYVEPSPDAASNLYGIMLLLAFLTTIYTAIVASAGLSGFMPPVLQQIQKLVWFIMGGVAGAAVILWGMTFMVGKPGAPKAEKKPKEKKEKKPKEKKAKEPKTEPEK